MGDIILEVKNAAFSYGEKNIFTDLSFKVKKGEIFCIVGSNGCGKTTLLDCLLGLLKLKEGEILTGNTDVKNLKPRQLAEKLAYVPQIHERTFPYTVKDIVLMGRAHKTSLFSSPGEEDLNAALEALKKVGILHLADRPYTHISGGQCQLVMIARALAQQPEIIIMDEPTSHLDFKNELLLLETIVELAKVNNIAVVMATHFPNHAFYFESSGSNATVALMNEGSFQYVGTPSEVLSEENIKRIYNINSKVLSYAVDEKFSIRQVVPLSMVRER